MKKLHKMMKAFAVSVALALIFCMIPSKIASLYLFFASSIIISFTELIIFSTFSFKFNSLILSSMLVR